MVEGATISTRPRRSKGEGNDDVLISLRCRRCGESDAPPTILRSRCELRMVPSPAIAGRDEERARMTDKSLHPPSRHGFYPPARNMRKRSVKTLEAAVIGVGWI